MTEPITFQLPKSIIKGIEHGFVSANEMITFLLSQTGFTTKKEKPAIKDLKFEKRKVKKAVLCDNDTKIMIYT